MMAARTFVHFYNRARLSLVQILLSFRSFFGPFRKFVENTKNIVSTTQVHFCNFHDSKLHIFLSIND